MGKYIHYLSGVKITLLAGAFLLVSLVMLLNDVSFAVDPAWAAIVICGLPLFYYALSGLIIDRQITAPLLISLAICACVYIGEIFAAGEIAFIMALGEILENKTVEKARRGIHALIKLAPVEARRLTPEGETYNETTVPCAELKPGDLVRVLPGETIPADGTIVRGATSIDQSVMTGESLPVDKAEGDDVFSGTINRFGAIDLKATKTGENSSLQKLIRMVKEAEENKAPLQRLVDKWAAWLVPTAVLIAIITYFITGDIVRAVTVLVVFCPCALALATPTAIMAAIGQATKRGVLIKSGGALEAMGKTDYLAFDKTGTLTLGSLTVTDVVSFVSDQNENDILLLAASGETLSEHPLGKAIVAKAKEENLTLKSATLFNMVPGRGIQVAVENRTLLLGKPELLMENGLTINDDVAPTLANLRRQGKAVILIADQERCLGLVALADSLRPKAAEVVETLRTLKTKVVLLTGDHTQTAGWFAQEAGVTEFHAELLPAQKVEKVKELQSKGHSVCMIGDGVNDAPALKTAEVGVAMGTMGSDIAIEAADIALMGDDLTKIPYLKRLAQATRSSITVNITLSMVINFGAIALSVMGVLTPVTGALVHNAGSVLVVLNAARLYDKKLD